MSMPSFPNTPNLNMEDSIYQVISSVAMEELALSHILNAEGEKLQYVLGTLNGANELAAPPTIDEVLKVNESVQDMLSSVSMNQMFLLGKMSVAVNAYSKMKGSSNGGGGNGESGSKDIPLVNGKGPYSPNVDDDNRHNNFSLLASVKYTGELETRLHEAGAIQLKNILTGSASGYSLKTKNPAMKDNFWLGPDKNGDQSINYNYIPDYETWQAAAPGLPVLSETLILSKDGYKDAEIIVTMLYNGSVFLNTAG